MNLIVKKYSELKQSNCPNVRVYLFLAFFWLDSVNILYMHGRPYYQTLNSSTELYIWNV